MENGNAPGIRPATSSVLACWFGKIPIVRIGNQLFSRLGSLDRIALLDGFHDGFVHPELSVSLPTVRVHLQRVFEKTGTNRQADLVRLMMMLDGGLHQPAHRV